MSKVAIYIRFGRKENLSLDEQKSIAEKIPGVLARDEPFPSIDELKGKGYEVVTLPKKKAWLAIWSSIPMGQERREAKERFLRIAAEGDGYEVIGVTEMIGDGDAVDEKIKELLEKEPTANGADVIYFKQLRMLAQNGYMNAVNLYNQAMSKGVKIVTVDGGMDFLVKSHTSDMIETLDEAEGVGNAELNKNHFISNL